MPPQFAKKTTKELKLRAKTYVRACGFLNGIWLFTRELFGDTAEVSLKVQSVQYPLFVRLNSPDILTFREIIERQAYSFDIVGDINNIVDAGANIGLVSIFFANRYPTANIIAIEPESANFKQLQKNISPYPQIKAVKAALWYRNMQLELFDRLTGNVGFSIHNTDQCTHCTETVDSIRVEDLLLEYAIDYIDLIKIDIEGAEKEVFVNSEGWIDKVGIIVAEMHDRIEMGCSRAFYNATNGFQIDFALHRNLVAMRK